MGIVETGKESKDCLVRSCTIGYTVPNSKDRARRYSGWRRISVSRSVQHLTLLLPVEEQQMGLDIVGNQIVGKNYV